MLNFVFYFVFDIKFHHENRKKRIITAVNGRAHMVYLHVRTYFKKPFSFFIAIDALLQQARANNQFNVFGYLNHIRTQRNHLVQTEEQYVFIHDALLEAIRSGVTEISRENLASYLEDFLLRPATSGEFEAMEFLPNESLIEAQFRLVILIFLYHYFKYN